MHIIGVLLLAGALILVSLHIIYNKFDHKKLSARVIYKSGTTIIDDEKFIVKEEPPDLNLPRLTSDGKTVTLDPDGYTNIHLAWAYTGNRRYEYIENDQWKEFLEVGKQYKENPPDGYPMPIISAERSFFARRCRKISAFISIAAR